MLKNEVNFKALTFLSEQTSSTFSYEVKGVRAVWDPSLSIPGTNRRGGWRCPVGTRYGGQITDRFGRSCGWGVARRIANQIADIGERLENIDDRKRNDRLARRTARVQRMLARQNKPGFLERGARNIAEALEGGQAPQQERPAARPRVPMRPAARPAIPTREVPELPRRDDNDPYVENLRTMSDEDLEKQYQDAQEAVERLRDAVDKPRNDGVIGMLPVSAQRFTAQQRLNKVNAELNRRGKRPPRRRGNLRESEQRRMEREIVQPGAPRTGEPPRPNAPRRRRRTAAQQGAQRTARRKPEADFVDSAKPEPTKVPRRKPAPKPPARPAEASSPIPPPPPWNPDSSPIPPPPSWNPDAEPDLGGSVPDARSIRNVVNRFGDLRGLPEDAYWRKPDFPEGEEKAELERRFGRYYDNNNKRNARGNFVNEQIFAQQAGAPQPAPKPQAPARPAGPPPMPARDINPDAEFDQPRDADLVKIVKDEVARYKPNAYNNLRNLSREQVLGKKNEYQDLLKEAQTGFDKAYDNWRAKKNGNQKERDEARENLLRSWAQKEKIKENVAAAELRAVEIEADIAFRQRPPVVANNNVEAPNAPRVQPPARPPDRPAEIPEPDGGWDVSPPTAKADHAPEKLNAKGADGFPDVKPVPVGNKGIDSKDKAVAHLNQGGDLADVPDDFLGDALHGATQRFDKEAAGGGVNGNIPDNMFKFTDKVTGKQYFLKYQTGAQAENEDIHEMVGNNIAGRFGMPVGGLRLDGKQKGGPGAPHSAGRSIVFEHAGNYVDGRLRQGRDVGNMGDIKPADRVRATLMDFVIVNRDRHGGNFFVAPDANGKLRFVPIDPSLGFDVNWGGRDFEGFGGDDAGFVAWMNHNYGGGRNEMLSTLRQQFRQGALSRREVIAAIADVQKSIREAERKNPYLNMVDEVLKTGGDGTPSPRSGDRARERIGIKPQQKMKYITDVDPSRIADLILG
jgi:hypothetical protein